MSPQRKIKALADVQFKTAADDDELQEGEFIAYPAVFDIKDSHGDIIRKGAFEEDIAAWQAKGDQVPVLYGHDMWNILHNIGGVPAAQINETDHGLKVRGRFDLESETGRHAYRMAKERRIADLSFAYDVVAHEVVKDDNGRIEHIELKKLKLYEVSFVPIGANRATSIEQVKSQGRRIASAAGRVQSAENFPELMAGLTKSAEALVTAFQQASKALADSVDEETRQRLEELAAAGGDETPGPLDAGSGDDQDAHTPDGGADSEEPDGAKEQGDDDSGVSAEVLEQFRFYALRAESR